MKRVKIDRLTLSLPRHKAADPRAIAKAVARAVEGAQTSQRRLSVVAHAPLSGEGGGTLANRVGAAVRRKVGSKTGAKTGAKTGGRDGG